MIVWVMKESSRYWPYDMLCVWLDEGSLLFIHEDGGWDIQTIECGLPSNAYWHRFEL